MENDIYIIYADELIFINFCLDLVCLYVTARLMQLRPRPLRLMLASGLGGLSSPVQIFLSGALRTAVAVATMLIMCLITAYPVGVKRFFKTSAVFALTSIFSGGLVTVLFGASDGISAFGLIMSVAVSAVIATAYFLFASSHMQKRRAEVTFSAGSAKIEVTLLVDSGNLAVEPLHSLPVIIVSPSALPKIFASPPDEWGLEHESVPITTATGEDVLFAFFPDDIRCGNKIISACVAVGHNTDYGGCDGLIPECTVR